MPSILRLPCVVSNGIGNRATGDRQNRATATGPPGAGLRDRTPTTPNAVRRAFAAGTRLRRARTSGGLPGSVVNARSSRPRPAGERRRPLLSQGGAPCGARRGTPNPAGLRGIGPRGDVRSPGDGFGTSRWWNPGERRERPVLPVGARRPADKAREGGAPTGRTGPGVFRPKRNDERRRSDAVSRDGSPAERRVGFITGCLAGMDRRPSPHRENWAAWVSSPVVWPGWIAGRTPRGFRHRLFGRDGSPAERRVGSATGCLAGMDRRPNAARVSLPAVWAGWIAGRTPRGFHHRRFSRDGSPAERRAGFTTGW